MILAKYKMQPNIGVRRWRSGVGTLPFLYLKEIKKKYGPCVCVPDSVKHLRFGIFCQDVGDGEDKFPLLPWSSPQAYDHATKSY